MSTQVLHVRKKYKMPGSSGVHRDLLLTTKEEICYHVHFAEGNKKKRRPSTCSASFQQSLIKGRGIMFFKE